MLFAPEFLSTEMHGKEKKKKKISFCRVMTHENACTVFSNSDSGTTSVIKRINGMRDDRRWIKTSAKQCRV